ncbi:MAG: CRISPR-associated helicase Cas3' [Clostridia bacterium]|nr:CRISPR-associated helicase Cas3' [Clostridia bacterium]
MRFAKDKRNTYFKARKDEKGNFQQLNVHLQNVSKMASGFASIAPNLISLAGSLHDIGKASYEFQTYLNNGDKKRGTVKHSIQGAFLVNDIFDSKNQLASLIKEILEIVISGHHGSLSDLISPDSDKIFFDKLNLAINSEYDYLNIKNNSKLILDKTELDRLFINAQKEMSEIINHIGKTYKSYASKKFALGLLIKYIYSCLIDADRLDAYFFDIQEDIKSSQKIFNWSNLIETFEKNIGKFNINNKISKIRSLISEKCKNAAKRNTGIYLLSVPTGGGKTLSSLRFALHHHKKRIIYVIPYLSIIEQTAKNIRNILELEPNSDIILEHHSNIVIPNDDEGKNLKKLADSRWDNPIIITTMVQFLETVMSSKASNLRKFHSMSNSVIIFDEIQSLPIKTIHLFNEVVSFLSKIMNATILLCSATQPLLSQTKKKNLLLSPEPNLIENFEKEFTDLKRTKIIAEKQMSIDEFSQFVWEKVLSNNNCLVIVNKKSEARQVCELLKEKNKSGILELSHLSTSMCATHRIKTLEDIKSSLDKNKKIICVSTQLIEAGVDISFDCVIRAMAGLDSIVQSAGRCNRNGDGTTEKNVYVVPLKNENLDKLIDIQSGKTITARIINENKEADYLSQEILNQYYKYYFFEKQTQMDYPIMISGNIQNSIYSMLSDNLSSINNYKNRTNKTYSHFISQAFTLASEKFKVIDNNTTAVVVYYGNTEKLLADYKSSDLKNKIAILQELQKYSVSLYSYEYEKLLEQGAITEIDEEFGVKLLASYYYSDMYGYTEEANSEDLIK